MVQTALQTCKIIVENRKSQLEQTKADIAERLAVGTKLYTAEVWETKGSQLLDTSPSLNGPSPI